MRRRKFIGLLGGAVAAWPLTAGAQQPHERVRRIGVLMHLAADDPDGQNRFAAFLQGLQQAGWAIGRNISIDVRWPAAGSRLIRPRPVRRGGPTTVQVSGEKGGNLRCRRTSSCTADQS